MKTYEIEMKRVSYITMTIEAASKDAAEEQAWERIQDDYYREDGLWDIESVDEVYATDDSRSNGNK